MSQGGFQKPQVGAGYSGLLSVDANLVDDEMDESLCIVTVRIFQKSSSSLLERPYVDAIQNVLR